VNKTTRPTVGRIFVIKASCLKGFGCFGRTAAPEMNFPHLSERSPSRLIMGMSALQVGHTHDPKRSRSRLTRDRSGQLGTAGGSGVIRAPARAVLCAIRRFARIRRRRHRSSCGFGNDSERLPRALIMGTSLPGGQHSQTQTVSDDDRRPGPLASSRLRISTVRS
jgi:hypothetical protein